MAVRRIRNATECVPYGTTAGLLPETSMNWTMPKSVSPEEAAASWNERRIYYPLIDGYGPQLKL